MTKMVIAYIGVLMLAMHVSSQVHVENTTTTYPMMNQTSAGSSFNMTTSFNMTPDVNHTTFNTTLKGDGVSHQSSAITLLIPLVALAGSLLQGRL